MVGIFTKQHKEKTCQQLRLRQVRVCPSPTARAVQPQVGIEIFYKFTVSASGKGFRVKCPGLVKPLYAGTTLIIPGNQT